MSRYRLPCATVRRDRRSHAVAQRHVYPLHLATPAMPTPESPIPSTPAKKEGGVRGQGRPPCSQNAHDETVLVLGAQWRAALAPHLIRERQGGKVIVGRAQ